MVEDRTSNHTLLHRVTVGTESEMSSGILKHCFLACAHNAYEQTIVNFIGMCSDKLFIYQHP